jgi:MFS family permease
MRQGPFRRDGRRWGQGPGAAPILSARFAALLGAQAAAGFAWAIFFLVPKFLSGRLGQGADAVGMAASVASAASLVAVPVAGWLADRWSRRGAVALGCACMALAGGVLGRTETVSAGIWVAQALQGAGALIAFNALGALAAELSPAGRMAQALGLVGAASLTTNALAPALGEIAAARAGWGATFALAMVASAVGAGLAVLATRGRHPGPERSGPPLAAARRDAAGGLPRVYLSWAATAVAFVALFNLHQPMALQHGVQEVRGFFIAFTAAALTVRLGLGGLTDRVGPARIARLAAFFYGAGPVLLAALGPGSLALAGAACGASHGALFPALLAMVVERAPVQRRGMALSFFHGAFNLGGAVAGWSLGHVAAASGYPRALYLASASALLGWLLLPSQRRAGRKSTHDIGAAS